MNLIDELRGQRGGGRFCDASEPLTYVGGFIYTTSGERLQISKPNDFLTYSGLLNSIRSIRTSSSAGEAKS